MTGPAPVMAQSWSSGGKVRTLCPVLLRATSQCVSWLLPTPSLTPWAPVKRHLVTQHSEDKPQQEQKAQQALENAKCLSINKQLIAGRLAHWQPRSCQGLGCPWEGLAKYLLECGARSLLHTPKRATARPRLCGSPALSDWTQFSLTIPL